MHINKYFVRSLAMMMRLLQSAVIHVILQMALKVQLHGFMKGMALFNQCHYPLDANNRHFRFQWYSQFEWLEYSPIACFACHVFGSTQQNEAFVSAGFQIWKTASEKFRGHQSSSAHKAAVLAWKAAKKARRNPETNVVSLVNHQRKKEVDENKRYLINNIETLIFLGRQGISFRGHRENSVSLNKGIF